MVFNRIFNSKEFYILKAAGENNYNDIVVCKIDDIYYFLRVDTQGCIYDVTCAEIEWEN